ncbi:hypothetical protein UPYG_G00194150 [Umbra pygmaea]|uniref:Uncharacterized protein n=1 Tax=Umbra pygmaea TaxID=75934 RepID=A0ABD0WHM6_UMBPY
MSAIHRTPTQLQNHCTVGSSCVPSRAAQKRDGRSSSTWPTKAAPVSISFTPARYCLPHTSQFLSLYDPPCPLMGNSSQRAPSPPPPLKSTPRP